MNSKEEQGENEVSSKDTKTTVNTSASHFILKCLSNSVQRNNSYRSLDCLHNLIK